MTASAVGPGWWAITRPGRLEHFFLELWLAWAAGLPAFGTKMLLDMSFSRWFTEPFGASRQDVLDEIAPVASRCVLA